MDLHKEKALEKKMSDSKIKTLTPLIFKWSNRFFKNSNSNNVYDDYSLWINEMEARNEGMEAGIRCSHYLCSGIVLFESGL